MLRFSQLFQLCRLTHRGQQSSEVDDTHPAHSHNKCRAPTREGGRRRRSLHYSSIGASECNTRMSNHGTHSRQVVPQPSSYRLQYLVGFVVSGIEDAALIHASQVRGQQEKPPAAALVYPCHPHATVLLLPAAAHSYSRPSRPRWLASQTPLIAVRRPVRAEQWVTAHAPIKMFYVRLCSATPSPGGSESTWPQAQTALRTSATA